MSSPLSEAPAPVPSPYRRNVAAAGLVAAALLTAVSVVLQPAFVDGFADRLAAIDEAGARGAVSAAAFVLAQLPLIAGVLGVAHLLRGRVPRLSTAAATLCVLGAFGHAVFGGISLVYVVAAADEGNRDAYASLMKQVEESPVMVFAAVGLVGTVLGLVLLGVSLWRSQQVARWIPVTMWLFLVVEFAGGGLSDYASALSSVLFAVTACGLAAWMARTPVAQWGTDAVVRPAVLTG
jgi:hypothetical protein